MALPSYGAKMSKSLQYQQWQFSFFVEGLRIGKPSTHSNFKILIPCTEFEFLNMSTDVRLLVTNLLYADIIIWNKVVICVQYCIDAVYQSMQYLLRNLRQFGGTFYCFLATFDISILSSKSSHAHRLFISLKSRPFFTETFRLFDSSRSCNWQRF